MLLLPSALLLGACGSTEPTKTVTVAAAAPAPAPGPTTAPKRAKKPGERHKPQAVMTACDANIRAKVGTTSCPFAQNVFYGYWLNQQEPGVFADRAGIPAYSPATGTTFDVNCSDANKIACRAGDGGYVTFSMAAVSAYNVADAKKYAATHELGDVPPPSSSNSGQTDPEAGGSDCDPNYEGACLDPNAYDYDCEGGSGDGPEYTGPVEVVGDDPYDLDRDGDGYGCDS
jgi:predicted Rdx family selenoprotein